MNALSNKAQASKEAAGDTPVFKFAPSDAAHAFAPQSAPRAPVTALTPATAKKLPRLPENGLAPSLERRRLQFYALMLVADVGILLASFAAIAQAYSVDPRFHAEMLPAYLLLPIYLTISLYSGSYSLPALSSWRISASRMITALLVSAALLNFVAFFAKMNADFSRIVFTIGLAGTAILMAAFRALLVREIRRRLGPSQINRLVIDAGGDPVNLPNAYRINAAVHGIIPSIENPVALDRLAHYLRNMDQVIVSCPLDRRAAWSEVLKGSGVHGEVVSSVAREIGAIGIVHHPDAQVTTMLVSTGPLGLRQRAMKRAFDLAVSAFGLLLISPMLLICALLIKLEDGGPVFFKQRRMGRGNSFFQIYKFRSMRVEKSDAEGNLSASKEDARITRMGRLMRRTSIDELPQLINVLKGDMSLVGPRPHALGSLAGEKMFWQIDRRYWQRHCLRPGITGLAQIRGFRGATETETDLSSRLKSDLEYVQGWSLLRDIGIMFATMGVLVHHRAF